MKISSPAFAAAEKIPSQYTCDGVDVNPPLIWSNVPADTKSLVLIVEDPDAPSGTWTHWTVWNIDPKITEMKEGATPVPGIQGVTDSTTHPHWMGPCPPAGKPHRYFFKLYALDTKLDALAEGSSVNDLKAALHDHVLATAELLGTYQK